MQAESSGKEPTQSVQTFGRKKTATAVAYCKRGQGIIRVNGKPLEQVEPKPLQFKLQEPLLLLGKDRFSEVDIRIRVKGGGRIAQIYAIRQALSKALVAYYQKCEFCFLEKISLNCSELCWKKILCKSMSENLVKSRSGGSAGKPFDGLYF